MTGKVSKLKTALQRLWTDRRGAIAPMVAVSLVPLLISVGVAVDVGRLVASRSSLQDATDAANLALARMPATTPTSVLQAKAKEWILANVTDPAIRSSLVVDAPQRTTGEIKLSTNGQMATSFSGLLGVSTMQVFGNSTVKYGTSHIELALVLDNTGSMAADGKLDALKSASKSLVKQLSDSAKVSGDPNALKIGVVPFSISVNVGTQYQNAAWMTGVQPSAYGADLFTSGSRDRFQYFGKMLTTWGGCVESRPMPYDIQDTGATSANGASMFVPFFAPDEPDDVVNYNGQNYGYGNDYLNDDSSYAGKAFDLMQGNGRYVWQDKQGDPGKYKLAPIRTVQSALGPYPVGPNSGCGTAPLLRMTTDMNSVNAKLDNMVAYGNTHVPLGLVWGWHLISPNSPFSDGSAYNAAGVIKIVVLVTDGANTYTTNANNQLCKSGSTINYCNNSPFNKIKTNDSNYTGYGYVWQKRIANDAGSSSDMVDAMNDRLAKLCTNMKAQKIQMYTVPVQVTEAGIKSLLKACATDDDHYIDVASADDLEDAFSNIAGSISGLRVAH